MPFVPWYFQGPGDFPCLCWADKQCLWEDSSEGYSQLQHFVRQVIHCKELQLKFKLAAYANIYIEGGGKECHLCIVRL